MDFLHTTTIAVLTADLFGRKPTVVLSTDGTPLNKRHMRLDYGLKAQGGLVESAKREICGRYSAVQPVSSPFRTGRKHRSSTTMDAASRMLSSSLPACAWTTSFPEIGRTKFHESCS